MCIFEKGDAGYIITAALEPGEATYDFLPFRSVAQVRLAEALARGGRVRVEIHWQGQAVAMDVVAMSPRSLTLRPINPLA